MSLPKASWSKMVSGMRLSRARARPSIQGRQRLAMARALEGGASPVSRSRTRRARASGSGASERSVEFVDAASLIALLEARGEIGGDAFHALRADGLDPRLLDRLEHGARLAARRRELRVQRWIVAGDGESRGVGMAADHRDLVSGRNA